MQVFSKNKIYGERERLPRQSSEVVVGIEQRNQVTNRKNQIFLEGDISASAAKWSGESAGMEEEWVHAGSEARVGRWGERVRVWVWLMRWEESGEKGVVRTRATEVGQEYGSCCHHLIWDLHSSTNNLARCKV